MLGAECEKAERRGKRGDDDGRAQGLAAFRKARHQRKDREPGHRGDRRDETYPKRIDPDRLQPYREKRQVGAGHPEQRGVKQRHPGRETAGCILRSCGEL
jgi:hypothetical protein